MKPSSFTRHATGARCASSRFLPGSLLSCVLLLIITALYGCSGIKGKNKIERQNYINDMRSETLSMLYDHKPSTKAQLADAAGYAIFSNVNSNLFILSAGAGYGVVRDNNSDRDTYMRMASAGVGIGLGIKDFRAVIVFENQSTLDKFIKSGWEFAGQADASAKSGDKGGELLSGSVNSDMGITVYQFTENGLVAQATLQGTKYWVDKDLN